MSAQQFGVAAPVRAQDFLFFEVVGIPRAAAEKIIVTVDGGYVVVGRLAFGEPMCACGALTNSEGLLNAKDDTGLGAAHRTVPGLVLMRLHWSLLNHETRAGC
jgi:hypothetical protein